MLQSEFSNPFQRFFFHSNAGIKYPCTINGIARLGRGVRRPLLPEIAFTQGRHLGARSRSCLNPDADNEVLSYRVREHRDASGGMLTCVSPWGTGQVLTGAALPWNLHAGKGAEPRKHSGHSGNVPDTNPRGLAESSSKEEEGGEKYGTNIPHVNFWHIN